MAYVLTINEHTATGEVAQIYAEIRDRLGDLPGVFKLMSADPIVLRHVWRAYPYAMEFGSLGRAERELTALAVSRTNACRYGVDGTTSRLVDMGMPRSQIESIFRADPNADAKHVALISLAENATRDPDESLSGAVTAANEAGLGSQEVREAATVVVWFNVLNRMVDGLGVPHDRPAGRGPIRSLRMRAHGLAARIWGSDSLPVVEAVSEAGAGETAVVILRQILDRFESQGGSIPESFDDAFRYNPRKINKASVARLRETGWTDEQVFRAAFVVSGLESMLRWDAIVRHLEDPLSRSIPDI